ncbi:MAG TPA: hypothetical protein VMG12_00765 [Polyangiaceae bacterium]|nr:hypothetical protein [Polyangiaceae bacterium]
MPVPDDCVVDADCGFGEIDHEIYRAADCPCVYGCPYVPLSTATIARRQSQYDSTCNPQRDGEGQLCGIDDCAAPPEPACIAGKCTAARDDIDNQ